MRYRNPPFKEATRPWPEVDSFLAENHGHQVGGASPHSHCFTLDCNTEDVGYWTQPDYLQKAETRSETRSEKPSVTWLHLEILSIKIMDRITKGSPIGTNPVYYRQCRSESFCSSKGTEWLVAMVSILLKDPSQHCLTDKVNCLLQVHKALVDWSGKLLGTSEFLR